jgi:hypothetical protein
MQMVLDFVMMGLPGKAAGQLNATPGTRVCR